MGVDPRNDRLHSRQTRTLQMDLAKSRADNFRLIPANSAVRGVLRVRAQSKIARMSLGREACSIVSSSSHEMTPLPGIGS
jgi:hypothetical protein